MDKGFLEDCLAKGMSLPQIGERVGKSPGTVGYWVKKHGLRANGARRFSPRGGLDRQALQSMVEDRLTLQEMADRLDRDISTVRYWLKKFELEPTFGRRRRRKVTDGPRFAIFDCRHHGMTEFVLEGRGYYRCKKCRSRGVAERRRVVKRKLVEEAGGACLICGYDRCVAALEFHHLDPSKKAFSLSLRGITKSIAVIREETAKCILLCSTCHAEVEAGFVDLPKELVAAPAGP